jgi:hypothetical protein
MRVAGFACPKTRYREQVGGEPHHPANCEEQTNSHEHGEAKSDLPTGGLLTLGKFSGQDGNEYYVVDSQYDFESR